MKSYEHVGPKWAPNVDFHAEALAPGQAPENLRFRFADLKALHHDLRVTLGSNSSRLPKLPDQAALEKSERRSLCAALCFCCGRKATDDRVEQVQQFMADLCLALREVHGRHDDFVLLCKPFGAFIRRAAIASRLQARSEAVIRGNFRETEMIVLQEREEKRAGSFFDPVADMIEEALSTPAAPSPLARGPWRRGTRETRGGRVSQRPSGSRAGPPLASPRRSALLAPLSAADGAGSFDRTASPLRDQPSGPASAQFAQFTRVAGDVVGLPGFSALDAGPPSFGLAVPSSRSSRGSGNIDVSFGGHGTAGAIFSQASSQRGRRLSGGRLGSVDTGTVDAGASAARGDTVLVQAMPAAAPAPSVEGAQEKGERNVSSEMELEPERPAHGGADASNQMSVPGAASDSLSSSGMAPADLALMSAEELKNREAPAASSFVQSVGEAPEKPDGGAERQSPDASHPQRTSTGTTLKRFSAADAHPTSPPTKPARALRRAKSDIFQPISPDETLADEMVFESKPQVSRTDAKMTPVGSPRVTQKTGASEKWEGIPVPVATDSRRLSPRPNPGPHLLRSATQSVPSTDRSGHGIEDKEAERKDPRSWSDPQCEPASDATRGRPKAGSGEVAATHS